MKHAVEYRVRPVTRFVVTKWEQRAYADGQQACGSSTCGEFDQEHIAVAVRDALEAAHRSRLPETAPPMDTSQRVLAPLSNLSAWAPHPGAMLPSI